MSDGDREWRFAEATRQQQQAGWPLQKQLMWRVGELTSAQSIDLAEHAEHFPEVIAGFSLKEIKPVLHAHGDEGELISKASLEDGGMLRVTGSLVLDGEFIGYFMRRLQLGQGWAIHERLVIKPPYRGRGIGARFVHRSLELYDALGLELVSVRAGLDTGRWYWAHMGFEFAVASEVEAVREWAREFCAALEIEIEGLGELTSASQFARLKDKREVCFEELVAAMPEKEAQFAEIALKNDFKMDKVMPLGQAVMLSGPEWNGHLRLEGAQRRGFEAAVVERSMKAVRRAEAELQSSAEPGNGETTESAKGEEDLADAPGETGAAATQE